METNYHIYVLKDPTDYKIRYVGRSYYSERRFQQHLWAAKNVKNGNVLLSEWINRLNIYGLKPIYEIIDNSIDENKWVNHFKAINQIYNKTCVTKDTVLDEMKFYTPLFNSIYSHFRTNNKIN